MQFLIIHQESNIQSTYLGRENVCNKLEFYPNPNKRIFKGMTDTIFNGTIEDLVALVKTRFTANLDVNELTEKRYTFTYGYKDQTLARDVYVIML